MELEEAIKTALIYEMKVRDVYNDAAKKTAAGPGRKVFQTLAKEEQYHVNYLQDRLEEWQKTGKITEEKLSTVVPSKKKISEGVKQLDRKLKVKEHTEELQLLRKALEVEQETSAFYTKVVNTLSGDGQQMFSRFLEIEAGHLIIVQAEIDAVSGSGFWYDLPEFSLETEIG